MEGMSFPEPPPLIGTPKKQNLNKFCDYHRDRGHNTNDCYQLKKQIEEAVASGKLAYLVKDIRQSNQRNGSQGRNDVKVINMINSGINRKRPYEGERSGLTKELTFPAIPRYSLTDEPIILEGMIEVKVKKVQVLVGRFLWQDMPSFRSDRPTDNHRELSQWKQVRKPYGNADNWRKHRTRGKKHNSVSTWNKCLKYKSKQYCEQGTIPIVDLARSRCFPKKKDAKNVDVLACAGSGGTSVPQFVMEH
ncbi:hypothetical protein Tco_1023771 [Tanacetum coccineum]